MSSRQPVDISLRVYCYDNQYIGMILLNTTCLAPFVGSKKKARSMMEVLHGQGWITDNQFTAVLYVIENCDLIEEDEDLDAYLEEHTRSMYERAQKENRPQAPRVVVWITKHRKGFPLAVCVTNFILDI